MSKKFCWTWRRCWSPGPFFVSPFFFCFLMVIGWGYPVTHSHPTPRGYDQPSINWILQLQAKQTFSHLKLIPILLQWCTETYSHNAQFLLNLDKRAEFGDDRNSSPPPTEIEKFNSWWISTQLKWTKDHYLESWMSGKGPLQMEWEPRFYTPLCRQTLCSSHVRTDYTDSYALILP